MKEIICTLVLLASFRAWAGATSVGDGGHGVLCHGDSPREVIEPLEMFEAEVDGHPLTADPAANTMTLFYDALSRVRQRFALTDTEVETMAKVGLRMNSPFCQPVRADLETLFIETGAELPSLSQNFQFLLAQHDCHLVVLAQRPNPLEDAHGFDRSWLIGDPRCPKSLPILFVHPGLYPRLTSLGKAVLALHEALRFLPPRVRPRSTGELRELNRSLW